MHTCKNFRKGDLVRTETERGEIVAISNWSGQRLYIILNDKRRTFHSNGTDLELDYGENTD